MVYKFENVESSIPDSALYYPNSVLGVEIFLSKEIKHHSRSIYNVLDFLGDIGGLFDALFYISHMIISIL